MVPAPWDRGAGAEDSGGALYCSEVWGAALLQMRRQPGWLEAHASSGWQLRAQALNDSGAQ